MKKILCQDINKTVYETDPDKLIFRPSVYGILIEDHQILLSKQFDGYDFPGGGMEMHETIHTALEREFFEETGLKIEVLNPIHCETSFFHPAHSKKHKSEFWNSILLYFLVRKVSGKLSTANFDEEERGYADMPEWVSLSDIENIKFINSIDSVKVIKKVL